MATLTAASQRRLVRAVARVASTNDVPVSWTKSQLTSAFNALESYAEDTAQNTTIRAGVGASIEAAAPGVFNTAQKVWLWTIWSIEKSAREGVNVGSVVNAFGE